MRNHRRPRGTGTKTTARTKATASPPRLPPPPSNGVDARDAAELLYRKIVRVEASASAARDALDDLPYQRDPLARRAAARAYALVNDTAEQAEDALETGERVVAALARGPVPGAAHSPQHAIGWGFFARGLLPAGPAGPSGPAGSA